MQFIIDKRCCIAMSLCLCPLDTFILSLSLLAHAPPPCLTSPPVFCLGWVEPLLDRIGRDSTAVVCPVIDVLDDSSLEFHFRDSSGVNVGGFDWNLQVGARSFRTLFTVLFFSFSFMCCNESISLSLLAFLLFVFSLVLSLIMFYVNSFSCILLS